MEWIYDDSLLSMDKSTRKKRPFAGICRFLGETIHGRIIGDDEESCDESVLVIPETDGDSTTPNNGPFCRIRQFLEQDSTLQRQLVSSFFPQTPHVSSYKYCHEAFCKLNEKSSPLRASSSPAAAGEPNGFDAPLWPWLRNRPRRLFVT